MKKTILFLAVILMTAGNAIGQHQETVELESFDSVDLDGNIRLYLEEGPKQEVQVEAKSERKFDDYSITVRNNTLFIHLHKKQLYGGPRKRHSAPKIKVYLTHPELKEIDVDGLVHVNSKGPITGESFSINGDGLIRGTVEVHVQELRVDLDGFCSMRFYGKATESKFRLDGLGKIDAQELETSKVNKSSDGLTSIKVAKL